MAAAAVQYSSSAIGRRDECHTRNDCGKPVVCVPVRTIDAAIKPSGLDCDWKACENAFDTGAAAGTISTQQLPIGGE